MTALSSINTFIGDGARTHWEFSFGGGYINANHIFVRRGDEFTQATLAAESTVIINPPVPYGEIFHIVRRTPADQPIVDFSEGARLTEENLDTVARQALFVAAEALDRGEGALIAASPSFLKVPGSEVAPAIAPRDQLKGKVLGVSADGSRIVGINWNGTDYDLETPFIIHDGESLDTFINGLSAQIEAERIRLNQQIDELVALADTVVEEATSTDAIDARLSQLTQDHAALANVVDALTALEGDTEGLATLIANETSQRIAGDSALAAVISLIGAKNGSNNAFILNLDSVKVSSTESLAQRFTALKAATDGNLALIQQEINTRAADDLAEVTARTQMGAQIRADTSSALSAAINTEAAARVAGDQAEATQRNTLAATLRGETASQITAAVDAERTARISGDNAEATNRVALAAALRGETDQKIGAAITTEATARANGDAAEASARQALGATLRGEATALVVEERNARVAADGVEAAARGLLASRVGTAEAAIASEQTARANADTAISNSLNAVVARVGSTESAVTTQAQALADVMGRTEAYWEVTAVAGGRAKLRVFADANGGGGVDIEGDVRISGNLLVEGTVNTSQITPNASSAGGSYYNAGGVDFNGSWQDAANVTVNMVGGAARVDFCAFIGGRAYGAGGGVLFRLLRNGSVIREGTLTLFPGQQDFMTGEVSENPITVYTPISGMFPMFLVDTSGVSGPVTYSIQVKSTTMAVDWATFAERQMSVTEFRR